MRRSSRGWQTLEVSIEHVNNKKKKKKLRTSEASKSTWSLKKKGKKETPGWGPASPSRLCWWPSWCYAVRWRWLEPRPACSLSDWRTSFCQSWKVKNTHFISAKTLLAFAKYNEALMYSKGSRNIMTEWHVMWFILIFFCCCFVVCLGFFFFTLKWLLHSLTVKVTVRVTEGPCD